MTTRQGDRVEEIFKHLKADKLPFKIDPSNLNELGLDIAEELIRIFKGINDFKVYHFGSIVTRKYKNHPTIKTESGSRGAKIFLLKWGITINFFKKFILYSDTKYLGELTKPQKNINYLFQLILCKLNFLYLKYIYNMNNKLNLL